MASSRTWPGAFSKDRDGSYSVLSGTVRRTHAAPWRIPGRGGTARRADRRLVVDPRRAHRGCGGGRLGVVSPRRSHCHPARRACHVVSALRTTRGARRSKRPPATRRCSQYSASCMTCSRRSLDTGFSICTGSGRSACAQLPARRRVGEGRFGASSAARRAQAGYDAAGSMRWEPETRERKTDPHPPAGDGSHRRRLGKRRDAGIASQRAGGAGRRGPDDRSVPRST